MTNFKKIIHMVALFSMVACLCCLNTTAVASGSDSPDTNEVTVEPRQSYYISGSGIVTGPMGNQAKLTVELVVRREASNSSGGYITGVRNATASNVSGWISVQSSADINGVVAYDQNHQVATVQITYYASIGSGYTAYTGTITLDLRNL